MADSRSLLALPFAMGSADEAGTPQAAAAELPSEAALLRGALQGDGRAWSRLIERHNHRVVVSLLGRGLPIDSAKDLAQETWLRLIESQRAGRLTALSLPGLAIVQAGYLAANARRHGSARDQAATPPPSLEPICTGSPPDQQVIQQEELQRIADALEGLSAAVRRVFRFVYEHPELSYAEAAEALGLSTQRVKQTICEVRKHLRTILKDEAS